MGQEVHQMLEAITGNFSKTKQEVTERVDLKKYPLVSEPALVHPLNSSTVKIRENGMIDVFVGTDNGIRINPAERSINLFANQYNEKVGAHRQEVVRDKVENVGGSIQQTVRQHLTQKVEGNWTVRVKGNLDFQAEQNISFTAKKNISLRSEEGDIRIHAKNHLYTSAEHHGCGHE